MDRKSLTSEQLDKRREWDKEYQRKKRAQFKEYKAEEGRIYREKYPEKVRAHSMLNVAIRKGKIKRSPCGSCGKTDKIHAHHPDYSKPLSVIWACSVHHKELHKI